MFRSRQGGTTADSFVIGKGLTSAQRVAILSPSIGVLVYDTTLGAFYYWDGAQWVRFAQINGPGASYRYEFRGTGYYRVATSVDVNRVAPAFESSEVVLLRETAGTSGTTEVDILVNGASIFLPANRPKVLASAGNQAVVVVTPDFPNIPNNARICMDILSVEDGDPQDLTIIVR